MLIRLQNRGQTSGMKNDVEITEAASKDMDEIYDYILSALACFICSVTWP